jgi:hypothetical protein
VRSVDLALYADALAARASILAAELERARARLRQWAIERDARAALEEATVGRLVSLGILGRTDPGSQRAEIAELTATLAALEELQTWVERELFAAREEGYAMTE